MCLDINVRVAAALVALGGDNLVVVLAEVHAISGPGVKVVLHVDGATDTLRGAYAPVLLESPGAVDGGLVVAGGNINVVGAPVGLDAALVLGAAAGVVGAVGFDHVVLDERVASPAVDGEVSVALGVEGTAIVDGASTC